MKKIGLVLGILTVLALLSGVALAECVRDCLLTYNTCLNLCKQTGKGNDSACIDHCMKGRDGCIKRCEVKNEQSENTTDCTKGYLSAVGDSVAGDNNIVLASNCIEKGLQCTLNGTPCCAPYSCKGKFPITYCK
jgi:hypothetical protein